MQFMPLIFVRTAPRHSLPNDRGHVTPSSFEAKEPMATEKRNDRTFYYHATREGNRTRKQYIGSTDDPWVAWYLRHRGLRQATHNARRQAMARVRDFHEELDAAREKFERWTHGIAEAWLGTQGHRIDPRTKDWRKMRRAPGQPEPIRELSRDRFEAIVAQAERGDEQAIEQLRGIIRANPEAFAPLGDLAEHCSRLIVNQFVRDNVAARESLLLNARELEKSLGIEDASPTERLLIQRVAVAWLDLQHAQFESSQHRDSKTDQKYFDARLERAQKRHADAVLNLERLRVIRGESQAAPGQQSSKDADRQAAEKLLEQQAEIFRRMGMGR